MAASKIKIKSDVLLGYQHWQPEVGLIITVVGEIWPDGYVLWITRGAENTPRGAKKSKHLVYQAFDFGVGILPPDIDREELTQAIKDKLGPDYYVYYGSYVDDRGFHEFIHAGWIK